MSPRRPHPSAAPPGVRLAAVEEVDLVIEKLVAGGDGLGRFEGIPIFVPRSAPGDRLRVRLVERRPDYGRAEIVAVVSPGPGRRPPPCPYFSRCGGCDLQHLDDGLQSRLKAAAVKETLERLGGIAWPEAVTLVVGEPWGYRLRTQLHTGVAGGRTQVGYHARRSHELVAVASCPILAPELEARLAALPATLPPEPPQRIELAAGDGGRVTAAPPLPALPGGEVEVAAGGFRYAFDARCFFQVHRGLVAELAAAVVGEWEGEAAFDLYGGVGLFALPLARRYRRVTLVEGDRVAARFARINARRNRLLGEVGVVAQAVESWVAALPAGADRVVVDPPRAGLGRGVRRTLLRRRPRRLTYASCHPAALARDLAALTAAYRLESLTLLDLFPQTGHIESVVQLVEGQEERP